MTGALLRTVLITSLLLALPLAGCLESISNNQPPTVTMSISPSGTLKAQEQVTFDATGSSDPGPRDGSTVAGNPPPAFP